MLYAPAALFWSDPFRAHQSPEEYVAWAFADQKAAVCRFGTPLVDHERAAVDWWAVITSNDGVSESLAGTSMLTFDERGLVTEQRDAWSARDGHHDLPAWAP